MAVNLDRLKAHLRVDFPDEDELIGAYLTAARSAVEKASSRILTERAVVARFDRFGDCSTRWGRTGAIVLPFDPVVSVEGVDYVDADGETQSLTLGAGDFRVVAGEPFLILPPLGGSFPAVYDQPGSVSVRLTAGYGGEAGEAPAELDAAVLLMGGHLYHNREAVNVGNVVAEEIPLGVSALCFPFRRVLIG